MYDAMIRLNGNTTRLHVFACTASLYIARIGPFSQICSQLSPVYLHLLGLPCTVWPEILAGIYFGGLMKLWHLAEFTLAVGLMS